MKLTQYQVDAFTSKLFHGNPAAVCPLKEWLPVPLMQSIAQENNLSETAFFVPHKDDFQLRWFTPTTEVNLCGHATLATAHVLFHHLNHPSPVIKFHTASGPLTVSKHPQGIEMDFPLIPSTRSPQNVVSGLDVQPIEVWQGEDYMVVLENQNQVLQLHPNFALLSELDLRGVIVTAPGNDVDFVSRFFAPKFGIPEDPVTGSAHCQLAPYWSQRLHKKELTARQLSTRKGDLTCRVETNRVFLLGEAVTFMTGEIEI